MVESTWPSHEAIKEKQQTAWEAGDYHIIGTTLQIVSEELCEQVDLRAGSHVLDVCTGSGNTAIAAARRRCHVTGLDYAPSLLELAEGRARAEHLTIEFQLGDAEELPFEDGSFDVMISTFGVQFAPNQAKVAKELLRVCRRGGRIALANWGPGDFFAALSEPKAKYAPPPPGLQSPLRWGDMQSLTALLEGARCVASEVKVANYRYESGVQLVDLARRFYGPTVKAFDEAGERAESLRLEMIAVCDRFNTASDGTLVIPAKYLTTVFEKE